MAEPRYSDERQGKLERWANGNCGAISEMPPMGFHLSYYPTIRGETIPDPDTPRDGYKRRAEAIAAARKFKELCRERLAETNGSM